MESNIVLILLVTTACCHGYMPEEFEFNDENYAFEMAESKCYFKVTLHSSCRNGGKIDTLTIGSDARQDEVEFTGKKAQICLPAKCLQSSGKVSLRNKVEIGGDGIIAKPDVLKQGLSNQVYNDEQKCLKGSSLATIYCRKTTKKQGKNQALEMEEPRFEDMAFESQVNNIDTNDLPMSKEHVLMTSQYYEDFAKQQAENNNGNMSIEELMNSQLQQQQDGGEGDRSDTVKLQSNVEGKSAKIQWHNWFRGTMYANCGNRRAISYVVSGYSSYYKDRIWHFYCKTVSNYNFNHCYWTGWQNSYDMPLFGGCGYNYVMTGIYSLFHSWRHDRAYKLLCCRAPYHYTRGCYISGYVNGFKGWMSYGVGGNRAFTSLFSYHDNGQEDRVWKYGSCEYTR